MSLETGSGGSSVGGFFKRAVTSVASGESMVKPKFSGTETFFLNQPKTSSSLSRFKMPPLFVIKVFGRHVMEILKWMHISTLFLLLSQVEKEL